MAMRDVVGEGADDGGAAALKGTSTSTTTTSIAAAAGGAEEVANKSQRLLYGRLQSRHEELNQIHTGYDGVQRRVEAILRQGLRSIQGIQEKKLQFLQAIRRIWRFVLLHSKLHTSKKKN